MTIIIEKKYLIVIIGIIILIFALFLGIKLFSKFNYEECAKEMKLNSTTACYLAADILSDYQQAWNNAISSKSVQNANGEWTRVEDFNEAVRWRFQYYQKIGRIETLDSLAGVVKGLMLTMGTPSQEYEKTHEAFIGLYNDMNNLISLVKEPKGNIMTFSAKVNELIMSVDTKFKETDLKISVPEDSVKSKVTKIQMGQMIALVAKKAEEEHTHIEKSRCNSEIYKKKGFKELPNCRGVLYRELKSGNGKKPKEDSKVLIHYLGSLLNGEKFDDSRKRRKPESISVNQIMEGWTLTISQMREGDRWEVFIPYRLAYKEKGLGNTIPPYSDLLFDIELIKVLEQ